MLSPILILATRFSWPHPIWSSRPANEYNEWLEERLFLFEHYTAKSLANCYQKPDYWVILVNANQINIHRRLENVLARTGCNYVLAPYEGLSIPRTITKACSDISYPANIITTNLDADDLVSSDFFAVLRSLDYPCEGNACVSFCSGSNFMPDLDLYFHSSYPCNPFLSLYETCRSEGEVQSVYFRMHTDVMRFTAHHLMPRSYYPMWASVVHGGNLANNSLIDTNRVSFRETSLLHQRFGTLS
jgi:hypothetical protein